MQKQKHIAILGAGESGVGAAVLAHKQGYEVFVSDKSKIAPKYQELLNRHNIAWEEEKHSIGKILQATEVIKSPGIPDNVELIKAIKREKIPVISEIEFAARYTQAYLIGITGSNGKTTTSMLTYHILKKAGLNVSLAGNVGHSFALQVATQNFDYYVLELSSFQLDDCQNFKANIAILLNVTPDHLDRYNYSFENYTRSKFQITRNQTAQDYFIYCQDDTQITKHLDTQPIKSTLLPFSINQKTEEGAYIENEKIIINLHKKTLTMSIHELALKGKHNQYNSMAAGIAARVLDLRKDVVRESLSDFQNAEHRLEQVGFVNGIEFINDSKATNVNATWYALESMQKPVVWIAGGTDKGNDYEELLPLVKEKVKTLICLGVDNTILHQVFDGVIPQIYDTSSAEEAVKLSYKLAQKGDVVLLSPACASFDLFDDYTQRGRKFKNAVREL